MFCCEFSFFMYYYALALKVNDPVVFAAETARVGLWVLLLRRQLIGM
jgi:hypothetical protein